MIEMAKFPYLTQRKGSQNWYYKRDVDPDLWADGRRKQVWRSLRTPERKKAEAAYAMVHAERAGALPTVPLTPALLRRLSDAHYLNGRLPMAW
jgi:hypothetical protein